MTVEEMISMFQDAVKGGLNPKDDIKAFDPDTGKIESVTGMLYGGKDGIVELCTDNDDEGLEPEKERQYYDGQLNRPISPPDLGTGG